MVNLGILQTLYFYKFLLQFDQKFIQKMNAAAVCKPTKLKRVSGRQIQRNFVPLKPPRRRQNRIMRFSKIDQLPKIQEKKSYRSMPTMIEVNLSVEGRRNSRQLCKFDRLINHSIHNSRSSFSKLPLRRTGIISGKPLREVQVLC